MKNIFSILLQAIGLFVGALLLLLGGYMGLENLQAPGTLNLPIAVFSLAGVIVGGILVWLVFKKRASS